MKGIVEGYVTLKNCNALEQLRDHRLRLSSMLEEKSAGFFDDSRSIQTIDEDIRIIETALAGMA